MHPKYLVGNWKSVIFSAVFIALGIFAILYPDAVAGTDVDVQSRRAWIVRLIVWAWGVPGGLVCVGFGLFCLAGCMMPQKSGDGGGGDAGDDTPAPQ